MFTMPVFIITDETMSADRHLTMVADIIDNADGGFEYRRVIIGSVDTYLNREQSSQPKGEFGPNFQQVHNDLLPQIKPRVKHGERYIVLVHNAGKLYDEMDYTILDSLGRDYRFKRDDIVVYNMDGSLVMREATIHGLHFSELV